MSEPISLTSVLSSKTFLSSDDVYDKTKKTVPDLKDSVVLSQQARARQNAEKEEVESEGNIWETRYGYSEGTTMLGNGRKQVVTFNGDQMELLEYKGDTLVKKMTGITDGNTMTTDVEHYDEDGKIFQKVRTTLTGLGDTSSKESAATMYRNVQWFDGEEVTKEMNDSMVLNMAYAAINDSPVEASVESLQSMASRMTIDSAHLSYHANVNEYEDGKLRRSAQVSYSMGARMQTNRTADTLGNMAPGSTDVQNGNSSISYSMTEYDQDGERLREASFSDKIGQKKKEIGAVRTLEQEMSVKWFAQGQLVKSTKGSLVMEESHEQHLPDRSGDFMRSLNISEEEYAADKPLSAGEMLAEGFQDNAQDGASGIALSQYGNAGRLGSQINGKGPYELTVENETYRGGELVARQADTERARENTLPVEGGFRTGGSLSENDVPEILFSSEHAEESYENGMLKKKATLNSHETVNRDENDVLFVETVQNGTMTGDGGHGTLSKVIDARLTDIDDSFGNTKKAWANEANLTVGDMLDMMQT